MSTDTAIRVFISYSHRDEGLRDQLVSHLYVLKRQNLIEEWYDRKIVPGEDFATAIDSRLETAEVVLLLVSSDFVSSAYCWEKELELSLERHEAGKTVVVPIIVRPVEIQDVPFARIESLPTDRKPVTTWDNRDEAWVDVVRGLRRVIRGVQERRVRAQGARTPEQIGSVLALRSSVALEGQRLKTGYAKLDAMISGLSPAELVVIASRPSIGKTTLALNIAMNIAFSSPKVAVGFFSLETGRDQMALRVLSAAARVSELRSGRISDEEWSRINGAISLMKHSPLYLEDSPILSTTDLRAQARKLKDQHGLGLLIVDHILTCG
jgi:replicative DNA helicase